MAAAASSSSSPAGLIILVAVAALSLIAAADARPCGGHAQTLLVSFSSVSRPNPDPTNPTPLTTTVVTVPPREAASSAEERAKDILVVVSGLLFGFGCGALTAASMYLVWSLLASTCASSYDDVYSDDEDDHLLSEAESPKKAGYVIIHDAQEYATGKN
ncbi:hypothetical protein PR202_ga27345 [Eleusine coracana subsp. coracana]|uniref:Uncharacterized protein n=1 Tax=Eleusine coracana subsp. coracana TaxID=191504 RepID=A0AAV5DEC0_ELECO|nr:hypothetical protein PR202_ga27345 [Eleusine coracana subsp. coracana]